MPPAFSRTFVTAPNRLPAPPEVYEDHSGQSYPFTLGPILPPPPPAQSPPVASAPAEEVIVLERPLPDADP